MSNTKHIALALMFVATTNAFAQPAPPAPQPAPPAGGSSDDQKKAEAKALYEKGLSHYNLGEFDLAIEAFRKAYAISQAPGLLFNIAQSFRLKKDYEQASYFYTTYLRLKPDAPNRADVEARLQEMQEALEEQKKQATKAPIGTIPPDGGGTVTTTTTTTVATPTGGTTASVDKGSPEDAAKAQSLMTAGYVTAGAGGALIVTGVIFGSMARSAESDLNKLSTDHGTWTSEQQDKYDAGKRNNTIAIISFIAGGAAVATGATLWVLGSMKKSKAEVAINRTAHSTTFAVGWSF
ncbi:MAG TPA: tetratricopeptide repeat protein [Kofleriaceae bacterium]